MSTGSLLAIGVAAALLAAAGCGGSKKKVASPTGAATPATGARANRPGNPAAASRDAAAQGALERRFDPIYFDYDTATLRPEGRDVLVALADFLAKHPAATLLIEGHADERGTQEYNLALGEERARAAQKYLVRLGVDEGRTRIISYGEERPAVPGDGEEAWSKNRRDELQVTVPAVKQAKR